MKPQKIEGGKKIRSAIKIMVESGISPMSIVFSIGRLVTPDERDYLLEYEKNYKDKYNP